MPNRAHFNRTVLSCCGLAALMTACGGTDTADAPGVQVRDVRVAVPAADPKFIDLVTPEVEIPAGAEKLYCMYLTYEGDDTAIFNMDGLQGEGGHHVVLLTTRKPKPVGTFTDCTSVEDMIDLDPFILPGIGLPDRTGISLAKGTQFVLQFHYVNPFTQPILVRDVARLHKRDVAEVDEWIAPFVTNSYGLVVPSADAPHKVEFDCALPFDVELLVLGGHLHEQGQTFEVTIGDGTVMDSAYLVDPWKPDFRDAPPVSLFFSNPLRVTQGQTIRTTCTWRNETGRQMTFPEEMCSAFGYAKGVKDPYVCADMMR